MLCSPRELGLGADHDGLMTLTTDAPPGARFLEVLALDDHRFELDTAPVRATSWGTRCGPRAGRGLQGSFRLPEIPSESSLPTVPTDLTVNASGSEADCGGVLVSIEPGSSCARFTAAVIRGVTVGPSPAWLRQRLEAVGQRSINNVVDATNYVMFELGRPLHAYDLARLAGPALAARKALAGERLLTLDGVDRALEPGMTVIADAAGPVGIAGVMGGHGPRCPPLPPICCWNAPGSPRGPPGPAARRWDSRPRRVSDSSGAPISRRSRRAAAVRRGPGAVAGGRLDGASVDCWPEPSSPPRIFLRTAGWPGSWAWSCRSTCWSSAWWPSAPPW
jgi:phenylalanyl-tRNA synthetase beta chain